MLGKLVFVALVAVAFGGKCESPKITSTSYSTTDGFFHFQTTFITEFSLQCAKSVKDVPFYAVVNGKIHSVAVSEETNKYQVSWTQDHAKSGSQTVQINLYDEDGIAAYKKNSATKPLQVIEHYHSGLVQRSPFASETVTLVFAVVALYYAAKLKAEVQSK